MGTRMVQLSKLIAIGILGLALGGPWLAPASAAGDLPPAAATEIPSATQDQDAVDLTSLAQAPSTATPPAGGTPAAPPILPETEVVAQPQAGPAANTYNEVTGPSILQGTVFSMPPVNGYNAPSSTVGTIVNVPDRIFPGTINTITRDTLRDQQILTMDELLRDVPSAVKAYGVDGVIRPDQFFIRGFEVTSQSWRKDGYLDPTYMPRDPANMQRVDVLAGPASVLYGAAQPTGTWNVTTKTAQADAFAYGGFMTGSYGLQRYTVDVNTPLNKDGTILFRLNAAYQNGNSNVQSVFNERTFVAPTFTFVLDDDTSLTWSTEYQKDRFRMYQGIPAINGDPFSINRNTFTGNPNGDLADYTSYRNTLTFTKILSDNWTLKVGEMSLWYNTPSTTTFLDNGTLNGAGLISSPIIPQDQTVASPFVEQNHDLLETLAGEFNTGPLEHKLVLGAEQNWFITNHDTFTTSSTTNLLTGTSGSAFGPINTAGGGPFPLTGPTNTFPNAVLTQNVFDNPSFRQNRFGFFGQDVVDVTDRLHVLMGARFDYMTQEYARSDTVLTSGFPPFPFSPEVRTYDTFNHFSPRAGITYDIIPDTMSAYAMYSKSFTPSVGVANFSSPTPLLPEIGDIWEGGIKTQLSDRFALRTSGYWIKEHNINVEQFNPNPGAAVPFFFTQAGLQRSQGVEANLTGQLTERLSTISNVSYNDSFLYGVAQGTAGTTPPIDQTRVRGVPHWLGNLWLRYNFIQEQQRTLGMALGMRYVGNRLGDYSAPSLVLPSYNVWDLGFYYNRGNLNGMLLWDNIFNDNYITSSLSQYQVIPGTPSNVRMQFSYLY